MGLVEVEPSQLVALARVQRMGAQLRILIVMETPCVFSVQDVWGAHQCREHL